MDLGFGGLIDKIDERFGKLVTNLLLLALIFLIFAWTVEALLALYVSGITLWESGGRSAILGFAKVGAVLVVLILASALVIYAFWNTRKSRSIRHVEEAGKAIAKAEVKKAEIVLKKQAQSHVDEIQGLASKTVGEVKGKAEYYIEILRQRRAQLDQQEIEIEGARTELRKKQDGGDG